MPRNPRHDAILAILGVRRSVSVGELTERLSVSEVTVRKDLSLLEDSGNLVRTRGGATLAEDRTVLRPVRIRRRQAVATKRRIAECAAGLVRDGETIFVDSGTTCALFAEQLRDRDLCVVTNSLDVVTLLRDAEGIQLYAVGGSFRRESGSFIGPATTAGLARYHVDAAYLGTAAISESGVLSSQNVNEAEVKRAAVKNASRRIVLCDSSKFGARAFATFAERGEYDLVIMEESPAAHRALRALGIETIVATAASKEKPT